MGLLLIFMLQMAANCFTPIWSLYTNMLGGDVRSAGIAILIFSWGTAFFSVITPLINHRFNIPERYFLVLGILVDMMAVISYFYIHDIYYFYAAQLLLSLGAGIQIPAFYVLYERHITGKNRALAWGALEAVFYFAIGLGSVASAFLFYHADIYAVFTCMLVLTIIAFILSFVFVWNSMQGKKLSKQNK